MVGYMSMNNMNTIMQRDEQGQISPGLCCRIYCFHVILLLILCNRKFAGHNQYLLGGERSVPARYTPPFSEKRKTVQIEFFFDLYRHYPNILYSCGGLY